MTADEQRAESPARQEFRRRASALGLSTVHIQSEQSPGTLRIAVGGSHVRLRGDPMAGCGPGGPRGRVVGFSRASRKRLLRLLNTIDRERSGTPLFVTLTYPAEWPGDPRRWKRDLQVWLHRLGRQHPCAWSVWRLEPQRRGAPHFHLLVFGVSMIAKEWLSLTWFEVVGSGDDLHLRAGTQVQRVQSWKRVIGYAAKYLAKEAEELPPEWRAGVGRWWGVSNHKLAPREVMEVRLGAAAWFKIRRVLRRFVAGPDGGGCRWSSDGGSLGGLRRQGLRAGVSAEAATALARWAGHEPP